VSEGNLIFSVNESKGDILVQETEFFIAVTHRQLENSGIDLPLMVAQVTRGDWKKTNE